MGLDNAPFQSDWQAYQRLREEIDALLLFLAAEEGKKEARQGKVALAGLSREQLARQWREKQEAAAQHWEQMTYDYPALTACERAPSLTAKEACELAGELKGTLVEYYQHAEGWCAFVVQADGVRHVALPLVDEDFLQEMSEWVEEIGFAAGRSMWTVQKLDEWHEAVIAPLGLEQKESEHVVLAPFGELRYLPLFAARDPETGGWLTVQRIIAELRLNASSFTTNSSALGAQQTAALLAEVATLHEQLATAQSQNELLTACDAIHQLVENTPILRQHLVSREINVTQTQHARAIKLKHWQNTAKTKHADPKMKAKLDNQMKKVIGKIDEALKGMSVEGNGDGG